MCKPIASWMILVTAFLPEGRAQEGVAPPDASRPLPDATLATHPDALGRPELEAASDRIKVWANAARDPDAVMDRTLRRVNWLLARRIEPAASRMWLGLPTPGEEAAADLEDAATALAKLRALQGTPGNDEPPARLSARRLTDVLETFAQTLGTLTRDPIDTEEVPVSAARLALLLEHENVKVVAAARLWLAQLARHHPAPERLLKNLDLPLQEPNRTTLRHAFAARLTRCEIISLMGGHAAALTLLQNLEERCLDWFAEPESDAALRALHLFEIRVLERWRTSLEDASERAWCERRIQRLREASFATPKPSVFRLEFAIPILTEIPDEILFGAPQSAPDPESWKVLWAILPDLGYSVCGMCLYSRGAAMHPPRWTASGFCGWHVAHWTGVVF